MQRIALALLFGSLVIEAQPDLLTRPPVTTARCAPRYTEEAKRARLEGENVQLVGRLETRKAVDRAKGILQRDLGMSEEEAYRMMQRESRQRRKSMLEIADAILLGDDLKKGHASEDQRRQS